MDLEAVGYNVRRLRKARGWKVRDLAALSGVSNATISRIENGGITTNTEEQARRLAEAFGVPYERLLNWPTPEGEPERAAAVRRRLISRDAYPIAFGGAGSALPHVGESLPEEEPDDDHFTLVVRNDCLSYLGILPGDRLEMERYRKPKVGDIVSVIVGGERHLKRVEQLNGEWILMSQFGELRLPPDGVDLEGVKSEHLRPVRDGQSRSR